MCNRAAGVLYLGVETEVRARYQGFRASRPLPPRPSALLPPPTSSSPGRPHLGGWPRPPSQRASRCAGGLASSWLFPHGITSRSQTARAGWQLGRAGPHHHSPPGPGVLPLPGSPPPQLSSTASPPSISAQSTQVFPMKDNCALIFQVDKRDSQGQESLFPGTELKSI